MSTEHIVFEWPSYEEVERVRREANMDRARILRDVFCALFSRQARGEASVATA
ncbi:hypothetical protein [Tropicimonas marinistellae]|uniref:hypothetical protein n=1 Tax=Tropicimonas marinistellae TaxID=1739787 RepID=UPI001372FB92|nr:hypothetical protein [Tropicimonas marinistellae]